MKKLLAAILAGAMLLSLNITAFAATAKTTTVNITNLTGNPVDEDGNPIKYDDSVEPNQTIYFLIPPAAAKQLNDSKITKVSVRKTKNSKLVKSVKLVEKRLTTNSKLVASVPTGTIKENKWEYSLLPLNKRYSYLAVELNDMTGSDEYKVQMDVTFTGKSSKDANYKEFPLIGAPNDKFKFAKGDKLTLSTSFFVANKTESGDDASITVGKKGLTIKPVKNETNEINFENDSDALATLTFKATSNPDKFYAKLSTKWTSDLLAKFKNTDAVIRKFSAATIDSTSRATLALANPFDPDDYDVDRVYIYSVGANNKLTNVTSKFTYNEDDDTFETKTRTLGTWIISDVKIKTTK
ncbi:hypothetical protein DWV16_14360 [Anaerotruncus sp. AF02-27]|uniref:hypothetical protein n=1 Tax=Anaerotruncus TaxID=244127 RepID=UPI000E54BB39|nr:MULTISPECIES: hypothetical protein [Anaerotruncus]RGX54354.1 hypothetical protein DWV16_14360 [Anaerotruncus sp. AF02-27]